ncbi:MAG: hypothetical protein ACP5IA_12520 [Sediminispirochaetaceae bacterium]
MYKQGKIILTAVCILLMAGGCATGIRTAPDEENELTVDISRMQEVRVRGTVSITRDHIYLLVRDVCLHMIEGLDLTADLSLQSKYGIIEACMDTAFLEDASVRVIVRDYFDRGDLIVMIGYCSSDPAGIAWRSNALLSPFDQRPLRGEGAFLEETAPLTNLCGMIRLENSGVETVNAAATESVATGLAAVQEMIRRGRYCEAEDALYGMCSELPLEESVNRMDYRLTYEILALTSAIDEQTPENLVEYKGFIGY